MMNAIVPQDLHRFIKGDPEDDFEFIIRNSSFVIRHLLPLEPMGPFEAGCISASNHPSRESGLTNHPARFP